MSSATRLALAGLLGFTVWAALDISSPRPEARPYIALDGDTIRTGVGPDIRLARVDAAELPGHCRRSRRCAPGDPYEQKASLQSLLDAGPIYCTNLGPGGYGRRLAECRVNGANISSTLINQGMSLYER